MLIEDQVESRAIESDDEMAETRLAAVGFVFHGMVPNAEGKRPRGGANLLHFARCPKLDRVTQNESKFWFRSIRVAKAHLDKLVGVESWKWCKYCEREVTQRVLNER